MPTNVQQFYKWEDVTGCAEALQTKVDAVKSETELIELTIIGTQYRIKVRSVNKGFDLRRFDFGYWGGSQWIYETNDMPSTDCVNCDNSLFNDRVDEARTMDEDDAIYHFDYEVCASCEPMDEDENEV